MKRKVLIPAAIILLAIVFSSCSVPFVISTLRNKNVYKTKSPVVLQRVYDWDKKKPVDEDKTTYILKPGQNDFPFIKYSVVEEGDNPIIYILPSIRFYKPGDNSTQLTSLKANGAATETVNIFALKLSDANNTENPAEYYFKFVNKPEPNQHYLATQSIVGMPITMPLKMRGAGKSFNMTMDLSLGYAFGYKIKLGNNPYKKTYINFIPYAFGFNKEKYKKSKDSDKEEETVSITYFSFGATYEYQSFNIGGFVGWDMMMQPYDDWRYQKKAWFSFGVGYKLGKKE